MLMSCLYFFSCELALLSLAHFSTEVLGVLTDWWESFPLQTFFFFFEISKATQNIHFGLIMYNLLTIVGKSCLVG